MAIAPPPPLPRTFYRFIYTVYIIYIMHIYIYIYTHIFIPEQFDLFETSNAKLDKLPDTHGPRVCQDAACVPEHCRSYLSGCSKTNQLLIVFRALQPSSSASRGTDLKIESLTRHGMVCNLSMVMRSNQRLDEQAARLDEQAARLQLCSMCSLQICLLCRKT